MTPLGGRGRETRGEPTGGRSRPIYLISTAGHPNYGDELIARAWLRHLAAEHPDRDVWLDCPHPGRAAHLFAGAHPRARFTNTLWQLAHESATHDPLTDAERVSRSIRELRSARFGSGLGGLGGMASLHLLGGGYLNAMWQDNLGILTAMVELRRAFGLPLYATGQGLLPASDRHREWLRTMIRAFDLFEVRDTESADLANASFGIDDAFLSLALGERVYDPESSPSRMVLVQGDLISWDDDDMRSSIASFAVDGEEIGVLEAMPSGDFRYIDAIPGEPRRYPFARIWESGLPARAGQRWLTTRFHVHLMAAAAGAAGTIVAGRRGYYDVKHRSLLTLGTGWTIVEAGADLSAREAAPRADPEFPERARDFADRKRSLARVIYP